MQSAPFYKTIDDVLAKAKSANGHLIKDFNIYHRDLSLNNKGVIGQIIEEGVFGYSINNRAEPDFAKLGIELKVTGLKQLKTKQYVAKERLVLNIIDYFNEVDTDFKHSSFWLKNQKLLLMFYAYKDFVSPESFPIIDSILYTYPIEDLKIIKDDWELISRKISNGEAHLISEADTMYLAACTKGVNGEATRLQPFSKIPAKQRAFCLKASYVNQIIKNAFIDKKCEKLVSFSEIKNATFEMAMESTVHKYVGKSQSDLEKEFGVNSKSKNIFELLLSKMFEVKGKINNAEEIAKANVVVKTIRVEENGRVVESMSFPNFKFSEIVNEEWSNSTLRNLFFETKFMFAIFKKNQGEYRFAGIKFWNMPVDILDSKVYDVWKRTKEVLLQGNVISGISYQLNGKAKVKTNFPGMSFNGICHVRPHARNAEDTYFLPVPDKLTGQVCFTKQCFWLNNTFIKGIIESKK